MMVQTKPRVVIVGAGFGGLWAARALRHEPVDVTLIDRNNYHAFWPLLYQVAAAELAPEQIAYPVRAILRKARNVNFMMGEVSGIDLEARLIGVDGREIAYDYLILALGSVSAYFNIPGAEEYTFPLKTMDQGIALRNHILRLFELAAREPRPDRCQELLTFAVVGGGPTGVEFAGALQELIQGPLCRDFPQLQLDESLEVRVVLLEMLDNLLDGMEDKLGQYARKRLEKMGVEVRTGTAVSEVSFHGVHLKDGSFMPTQTVIWTAGVRGHPLAEIADLPLDKGKRVVVQPTLQVSNCPNLYVIGDMASFEEDGQQLPMLAPVATQQGRHAAANIMRQIREQDPAPFHYRERGTMATVGRNAAVAELFDYAFTGFIAWLIWLAVHLFNLIGFRNRLAVLTNWAYSYLLFEQVVRLILPQMDRAPDPDELEPEPAEAEPEPAASD